MTIPRGTAPKLPSDRLAIELSQQAADIQAKSDRLKVQAWWATGLWLVFVAVFTAVNLATAPKLVFLELNEFGDFFAGVSAPLAFLWLVVGFYQQGYELRQNTLALNGQLEELRASVEQQKISVQHQQILAQETAQANAFAKERLQAERYREIERAQPKFVFNLYEGWSDDGDGIVYQTLNVQNVGSSAKAVSFIVGDDQSGFMHHLTFNGPLDWPGDEKYPFWIYFDRKDPGFNPPGRFRIEYWDASGLQQWQDYVVQIHRSAEIVSVEVDGSSWHAVADTA